MLPRCLFLLLLLWSFTLTYAQNPILIPYNDHGTWGFCDTLGNITIEPAYAEADFFTNVRLGDSVVAVAPVRTQWGNNWLRYNQQFFFPEKMDFKHQLGLASSMYGAGYFLLSKKGRLGIFQWQEGLVLPCKYDTLINVALLEGFVLMKKQRDKTYTRFLPTTKKRERTDIVAIETLNTDFSVVITATTQAGEQLQLKDGELIPFEPKDFATDEEIVFEDTELFMEKSPSPYHPVPQASRQAIDQVIAIRDYGRSPHAAKYGFRTLVVGRRGKYQGVVNEVGEVILPFQYDTIEFMDNNRQIILHKDGKVGCKLVFTHHPPIEPVYDKLRLVRQLRVKPGWLFAIFEAEKDGQTGYVGENAVVYFNFD